MPRVGDGTGMGSMPPEADGLTHREDTPEKPGKPYSSFTQGRGAEVPPGANRTTPIKNG